jgi:putative hydrolase of the HAD superfamily|tara:strand:+ start:10100 stop:11467 length:1368 start_codon:yes stop_codon:yes gene_type:complete
MSSLNLRSPNATLGGVAHLARLIDKIRAFNRGELPADYQPKLGVAFDGFVCDFLGLDYSAFRAAMTALNFDDEEALVWIKSNIAWPSDERILFFNTFLRARGWRDSFRETLPKRLEGMGLDDDGSIKTCCEMIDTDEGRPVPQLPIDGEPADGSGPERPSSVVRRAAIFQEHASPLEAQPTDEVPVLPKLSPIKSVVFDIYGTLIISGTGDISLAENEDRSAQLKAALTRAGITGVAEEVPLADRFHAAIKAAQDERRADGIEYPEVEIREVWTTFLTELSAEGPSFEVPSGEALEQLAIDYECRVNPVWPMPNLAPCLASLASSGLTLGIVSNAQFYTRLMFPAFMGVPLADLGFALDCCVYSYSEREGKPSTALYEKLATRLKVRGIEPSETLYVGNDLRNDVWPAQLAGFKTALFAGDKRSLRWRKEDSHLDAIRPDAIITDLWQLPKLVSE